MGAVAAVTRNASATPPACTTRQPLLPRTCTSHSPNTASSSTTNNVLPLRSPWAKAGGPIGCSGRIAPLRSSLDSTAFISHDRVRWLEGVLNRGHQFVSFKWFFQESGRAEGKGLFPQSRLPAGRQENDGRELGRQGLNHFSHQQPDRKSTRLNSSHLGISYAVFCL